MCYGCYEEDGYPWEHTPIVDDAVRAVRDLYERHAAGGAMHIVTDDDNVEDHDVEWCLENLCEHEDDPATGAVSFQVGLLFREMTEAERWTTLAIYREYRA